MYFVSVTLKASNTIYRLRFKLYLQYVIHSFSQELDLYLVAALVQLMADVGSSLCLCLMQTPGFSKITLLNDITDCQSFEIKHQRFFLKEALMSEQQCSRCDLLQLTKHASIRISLRRLTNVAPKLMKEK